MNTNKHDWTLKVALWVVILVSMFAAAVGVLGEVIGFGQLNKAKAGLANTLLALGMIAGIAALQLIGFMGAERTVAAYRERRWLASAIGAAMFVSIVGCNAWWSHRGWVVLISISDQRVADLPRDPALLHQEITRAKERLALLDELSPELFSTPAGVARIQSTLAFVGADPRGVDGAAGEATTAALAAAIASLERDVFTLTAEQAALTRQRARKNRQAVVLWVMVAVFESLGAFGRFWLLGSSRGETVLRPACLPGRKAELMTFRTAARLSPPATFAPAPQTGAPPFAPPAGKHWVLRHGRWHLRKTRLAVKRSTAVRTA